MIRRIYPLFAFIMMCFAVNAQVNPRDSVIFAPLICASYAVQFPGGDMAERFGTNSSIGGSFLIKNRKNLIYGVEGRFIFGDNVKDTTILDNIESSAGFIIDQFGEFSDIIFYERGFMFSAKGGKLFNILGPNPNSGFVLMGGVGFLQHKIRIDDQTNTPPQLQGDYKKGYDRLSNGLALSEYLGYRYFGNRRLVNFFIGVEFIQAFTKNRRSFNFDTMEKDNKQRLDLLYGIRAGWTIPFYKKIPREYYFH